MMGSPNANPAAPTKTRSWFGFWLFLAVFIACDHWVFSLGYESFFQRHLTPAEKELQQLKIEELRLKIDLHRRNQQDGLRAP